MPGDDRTEVVFVHDAEAEAGLGHRRRVEALATEVRRRGASVRVQPVDGPVRASAIVVDSYRTRADDRTWYDADVVGAIDDLERDLAVDVLVDPSPGATDAPHRRAHVVLAGADYALVDPALHAVATDPITDDVRSLLVTTGAADRAGVGVRIARALTAASRDYEVRLVVGPWGSQVVPPGVTPVRVTSGLADELARADLVVTAGGVTLLESLVLGRPTVCVIVAENQRRAFEAVVVAGAAVGAVPESAAAEAGALLASPERRRELAACARKVVDGRGAARVADAMIGALVARCGGS